jgi:hypothetical protein
VFSEQGVQEKAVAVLSDIREVWDEDDQELGGADIFDKLVADDRTEFIPDYLLRVNNEGDYMASAKQKARWVAKQIKNFELKPRPGRDAGRWGRRYDREDFERAWVIYCPQTPLTPPKQMQ